MFTAIFWVALIILNFVLGGDIVFVLMTGAMLAILIALPFAMSTLNRSTFRKAAEEYGPSAVEVPLSSIDGTFGGKVVRTGGTVSEIGRLWLAKPRYTISDGEKEMEATAMFMPKVSLSKGDRVEILGVINQGMVGKGDLGIQILSIEKD